MGCGAACAARALAEVEESGRAQLLIWRMVRQAMATAAMQRRLQRSAVQPRRATRWVGALGLMRLARELSDHPVSLYGPDLWVTEAVLSCEPGQDR